MSYVTLKKQAEELLTLAAAYAGDGAVETAILRAERALRLLRQARTEKVVIMQRITSPPQQIEKGPS